MIRSHAGRKGALLCAAAILLLALADAASAQQSGSGIELREIERAQRERELETIKRDLERRRQAEAKLTAEIESIRNDRKKLNEALLDTASRTRAIEESMSAAEARLKPLDGREKLIRDSLQSRRSVLAEVLGALTRLNRQPAPALIVRPEDALQSVRSAMLMGALVPELRVEADSLVSDLTELTRVRREILAERAALDASRADLEEESGRTEALVEERRRLIAERQKSLAEERARAEALARKVETVTDLIAGIEHEIDAARRAAEAARRKQEARHAAAIADPVRMEPTLPFAQARGRLPLPVAGTLVREFGKPDAIGGTEKGMLLATRSAAQVTAPCEGWVVYAGLFRSYGRLLIINAGGGYHVLLAGMEQITVDIGQFVLTGEPVAVMGSGPRIASAAAESASQPTLYIEFRKDGDSIDPTPWWAETESGKARG